MTIQIPVGFMNVSLKWSLLTDPEPMVCTIGADTGGDPQEALDTVVSTFIGNFPASETLSSWTFLGATAAVGQDGGPPNTIESPAALVGTESGVSPPNNCALLMRKITGLGGRKGRGRMFFPPFNFTAANFLANGQLGGGVKSSMDTALSTWRTANDFYLLHSDATPPTPITAIICDPKLATQRRRMRP